MGRKKTRYSISEETFTALQERFGETLAIDYRGKRRRPAVLRTAGEEGVRVRIDFEDAAFSLDDLLFIAELFGTQRVTTSDWAIRRGCSTCGDDTLDQTIEVLGATKGFSRGECSECQGRGIHPDGICSHCHRNHHA